MASPASTKVMFNNGEGSVLKEWETMHRPPENIPTSGPPQYTTKLPRAGLIVPPPPKGSGRRHSVISSSKDVTSFPLKPGFVKNGSSGGGSGDIRRPSEVWLGKKWSNLGLDGRELSDLHPFLLSPGLSSAICVCLLEKSSKIQ